MSTGLLAGEERDWCEGHVGFPDAMISLVNPRPEPDLLVIVAEDYSEWTAACRGSSSVRNRQRELRWNWSTTSQHAWNESCSCIMGVMRSAGMSDSTFSTATCMKQWRIPSWPDTFSEQALLIGRHRPTQARFLCRVD